MSPSFIGDGWWRKVSLDELRAGVEAQTPTVSSDGTAPLPAERINSGRSFLRTVGGERHTDQELSWLG